MPEAEHRFAQYQGLARRVIPKLDEKTINWAARVLMLRRRYQPEKFSHVRRRFVRVVAALARKTDEEVPAWASL